MRGASQPHGSPSPAAGRSPPTGRGWLLALAVMVCVYNTPRLLFGTVQFDALEVHYSAQKYLSDELHAGRVPFWTPYIFSGFPFLADLQVGAWYPLNWPFFLFGITPRSISGELFLHSLIACVGTYALALRMLGSPAAGVIAAMFYGFSGWFAAHSQHVGMFDTAAWLPWLVLLGDRASDGLSYVRVALAALLGAALALPGHFQVALYTLSGVVVWAVLEAISRRSWSIAGRFAAALVATGIGGGLLSAVMVLPALELVGQSVRTQLDVQSVDLGYFHPASLLTLVDPDYYGLLSSRYHGPGDSTQHYFYAGLLLAPFALIGLRNRRVVRTAAFLGVPFLLYALGPRGGLFNLVVQLPGFNSVELPMHGWYLPALGLALLGGAGFGRIESRLSRRWVTGVIATALLVDQLVVNQLMNPLAYARGDFADLYGARLQDFHAQNASLQPPIERLYGAPLSQIGYRNHALQSRVETTYGYNPLELTAYAEYAAAAENNPLLINGLAANYRLTNSGRVEPNPDALPLAYFSKRAISVADEAEASQALAALDPSQSTIVVGDPPPVAHPASAEVSVAARGADFLTVHYRTIEPGLLRVAIPLYPGWRATLDNTELPVVKVDGAFIGIRVPPGEADLHLRYTPRWFWMGAGISVVALLVIVAALLWARFYGTGPPFYDTAPRFYDTPRRGG